MCWGRQGGGLPAPETKGSGGGRGGSCDSSNDVERWHDFMLTVGVMISAHLHGSVMVMMTGVPTVVLANDYRITAGAPRESTGTLCMHACVRTLYVRACVCLLRTLV